MSQSHASPTEFAAAGATRLEQPPPAPITGRSSRSTVGRTARVSIGALFVLVALALLGAGGTGVWADRTQREAGYVTTGVHDFSTTGAAVATEATSLGAPGVDWLYTPSLLGKVRIRVTPARSRSAVFVGIGPSASVDHYLAGVHHTLVSDFFRDKTQTIAGRLPRSAPGRQRFWVASATGTGAQTIRWEPTKGSWSVVVMNANGKPGIAVGADLGARMPAVLWIAIGLLLGGAVFMAGGVLLIASAFPRNSTSTSERKGGVMSTTTITVPAAAAVAEPAEAVDRYAGIKQYSLARILAVWAAAALPMGILAWIVAPAIKDSFSGAGIIPMFKALILLLTAGLLWQCVLVAGLVWHEQRTFRWSVLRNVLWLRSPRSPSTGRVGGRLWLLLIPLTLLFALGGFVPTFSTPKNRDLATFIGTDAGKHFMHGNWGWYTAIFLLFIVNIVAEELLFRGVLLPRMKGVFGRRDWLANAILFTGYHLHEPWLMPGTLVCDTFAYVYPSRRYQSTWIGIIVHGAQTLFFGVLLLALVLR
jgi:membrane protease YdiL (CAAX protease family)